MKRISILLLVLLLSLASCGETPAEERGSERLLRRWHGAFTDHLIPSEDYGTLYRFYAQDPRFPDREVLLCGLMTRDGTVVVDAVYTEIREIIYAELSYEDCTRLPVYLLQLTNDDLPWDEPADTFTVMARDGSWIIEGSYAACCAVDQDAFLLADQENNCKVFDTGGTLLNEFSLGDLPYLPDEWREGLCVVSGGEESACALFNANTGAVSPLPGISGAGQLEESMLPVRDAESGLWGYLDLREDQSRGVRWAVPPLYSEAGGFRYGTAKVRIADNVREAQIDRTGNILMQYQDPDAYGWYVGPYTVGGRTVHWVQEVRKSAVQREAFYDEAWNLLGEMPEGVEAVEADGGDLLLRLPGGQYQWASQEKPLSLPDYCERAESVYVRDGILEVYMGGPDQIQTVALLRRDGTELIPPEIYGEIYTLKGAEIGRPYYLGIPPYGTTETQCRVHDEEGAVLFTFENDWESRPVWYYKQIAATVTGRETFVYSLEGDLLLQL